MKLEGVALDRLFQDFIHANNKGITTSFTLLTLFATGDHHVVSPHKGPIMWKEFMCNDVVILDCNALWSSDAMWRQEYVSTLAHVMSCCLTAPSHYLKLCWLIINGVRWQASFSQKVFKNWIRNLYDKITLFKVLPISQGPMSLFRQHF